MILNTLYCNDNNRCYFLAVNLINKMTEEVGLNLVSEELEDGTKTNTLYSKDGSIAYYTSDNPLKIVDFLNGFKKGLESTNTKRKKK